MDVNWNDNRRVPARHFYFNTFNSIYMLITVEKKVTESVEMQLPAYFSHKHINQKIAITKEEDIVVAHTRLLFILKPSEGRHYQNQLQEVLSPVFEPCSVEEFEATYNEAMNTIVGAYNTMLAF